jgi:N-methylhydantoinase A/oxoprolinase/acetone carboxylase beta subunit
VLHGTTVATNMILEGRTARTALITTQGFRHVLESQDAIAVERHRRQLDEALDTLERDA